MCHLVQKFDFHIAICSFGGSVHFAGYQGFFVCLFFAVCVFCEFVKNLHSIVWPAGITKVSCKNITKKYLAVKAEKSSESYLYKLVKKNSGLRLKKKKKSIR